MGGEYFLAQDPYNFDDELLHMIYTECLNEDDLRNLYEDGLLSQYELDYYIGFYNFYGRTK